MEDMLTVVEVSRTYGVSARMLRHYAYNGNGDPETMFGTLEEHLNYHEQIRQTTDGEPQPAQLDLLIPVKRK